MRHPNGNVPLIAILAHPVAHVRAPEFLNPMIEKARLDGFLVCFHILPEDVAGFVPQLVKIRNLKGVIITIPHKEAMARLCKTLGPNAAKVGTANTVRFEKDGSLSGEMFDGIGLVDAARTHGMDPKGKRVLLVGAGGAARAIAFSLAEAGCAKLTIANRTAARAEALAKAVSGCEAVVGPADATGQDLVVQATSLGLHATDPMPVDPATFAPGTQLFDIIAPRDTELMAAVAARGCKVVGGRPMVEHQAMAQLAFLGLEPLP